MSTVHRVPFTTQERHAIKQIRSLVGGVDYWRGRCGILERELSATRSGLRRQWLLKELLSARQAEERAILDLRDGSAYLCRLVTPAAGESAP